jgi:membrane protease subunit (stomatin/prohibitin family)
MARTAVIAGTATAVSGGVARRQAARNSAGQPTQEVQASPDDSVAELQQLAQLKEQGILTQEEFDAKKKQILGI